MVEVVAGQALADALAGITAEMTGQGLAEAYNERMTDPYYSDPSGIRYGKGNKTTTKPAVTGDTENTITQSTEPDPIDAFDDYVTNVDGNVSAVTGGVVSGSNEETFDYSLLEKPDNSLQAVTPVAIPTDYAAVAIAQALGVSMKWNDMSNALQQKFIAEALLATGVYSQARNLVIAWWDGVNILLPNKLVQSVSDFFAREKIGQSGREDLTNDTVVSSVVQPVPLMKSGSYPGRNNNQLIITMTGDSYFVAIQSLSDHYFFYGIISKTYGAILRRRMSNEVETYTMCRATADYRGWYYGIATDGTDYMDDISLLVKGGWITDVIDLLNGGTITPVGGYPEGTSRSSAPSYAPTTIPIAGGIATSQTTTQDVVAITLDGGIDTTGRTQDPNGPTDETVVQSLPQSPTLPVPGTLPSDPTASLSDSSVIDSTRVDAKVKELADSIFANPPISIGIIPFPELPNIGGSFPSIIPSSGPGLIHVYNPTPSEFISFGRWLWVTYADATIDKIWNNPFDGIVGAFELYATPATGGTDNIYSGFLICPTTSKIVPQRYTEIDCGTVIVPEFYGNYFDYSPYSQCYIYLPFIGINEVSIDDIVGHAVNIRYRIDAYNGSCIAMIYVAKNGYRNLCYQFAGNCAVEVPLAGGSQAAIKAGMIQSEAYARASMIGTVAGGINSIGQGAASGALHGGGLGALAGGLLGFANGVSSGISNYANQQASIAAARVANKSSVQHSGQFGASHGAMGAKKPFIIIRNPIQVKVVNYNEEYGFPAHKRVIIGACKGYLQVREVNVISAHATNAEKAAIENALKSGVYVE